MIGGGLIGCEVAATCRTLGLDVTIVEAAETLLQPVLGATAGRLVSALHDAHGVRVLTGTGVSEVSGDQRIESVTLSSGERLRSDVVVVAVGARPRTDWLAGSGLSLDDGVRCAPNLRALDTDSVVAVGDIARFDDHYGGSSTRSEHWENAIRQADTAARTLLDGPDAPAYTAPTTFWSTQYQQHLHVLGQPSATDEVRVEEGALAELSAVVTYHRAGRVTAVLSVNRPARLRAYRHLLEATGPATAEHGTTLEGVRR